MTSKIGGWMRRKRFSVCMLIAMLLGTMLYSATHWGQMQNVKYMRSPFNINSGYETVTQPMVEDVEYAQPFVPLDSTLDSFILAFYDSQPDAAGQIYVRIKDDAGQVLFETILPQEELASGKHYRVDNITYVTIPQIHLPVDVHRQYTVALCLKNSVGTPASIKFIYHNAQIDNLSPMHINGEEQDGYLYFNYQNYSHTTDYLPNVCILFCLSAMALLMPAHNRLFKSLFCLAILLAPLAACYIFEAVAGYSMLEQVPYVYTSLLMLYAVLLGCCAIFGRKGGGVLFLLVSHLLALVNYYVIVFRGSSISIADIMAIKTAATIMGQYDYTIPVPYFCFSLGLLTLLILILRAPKAEAKKERRLFLKIGIRVSALCGAAVMFSWAFAHLETAGYDNYTTENNYKKYGWLYTNCIQVKQLELTVPDGYSQEETRECLASAPIIQNTNAQPAHLIVIMNESFADLSILDNVNTNQDPLAYYHSLEGENIEKGYLAVPVFGGGTSNTEWEVLSNQSLKLLKTSFTPYNFLYSGAFNTTGLTSSAKSLGYRTLAMHPFGAKNWNRDKVYPAMGFDAFWDVSAYSGMFQYRDYISDSEDYRKIMECTAAYENEKVFIFNVTMQNHGGYSDYRNVPNTVSLLDYDGLDANLYMNLISLSDQALKELLEYYENVDEPTMIVFFGDHMPGFTQSFYDYVFATSSPTAYQQQLKYITPFFIWTNYQREKMNTPFMSSNYFGAYIKQAAGMELTAYENYCLSIMREMPVIGQYGIFDQSYEFITYDALCEGQESLIQALSAAQYYHLTNEGA